MGAGVRRAVLAAWLAVAGGGPSAACELTKVASLPVTLWRNLPMVDGSINGQPVRMLVDTGADLTVLWAAQADALQLKTKAVPGLVSAGIGGSTEVRGAEVKQLAIGPLLTGVKSLPVEGVGDRPFGVILGRDLLSHFEVEFDLPAKTVTLFRAKDCGEQRLSYWSDFATVAQAKKPPTDRRMLGPPPTLVPVALNGKAATAILDSGAQTSMVTTDMARAAGAQPDGPDAKPAGATVGTDGTTLRQIALRFASVTIGDEVTADAVIRVADLYGGAGGQNQLAPELRHDMVIGADFLMTHRLMVAYSQNRLYFTRTGEAAFPPMSEDEELEAGLMELQRQLQDAVDKAGDGKGPPVKVLVFPQ